MTSLGNVDDVMVSSVYFFMGKDKSLPEHITFRITTA